MSMINGVAKKYDGTAIDYVSIFNWIDGTCVAQIKPDALGQWEYVYTGNLYPVGITYVADGCKPITHGAYELLSDDPYFTDVDLLLIADTDVNSYKDWSINNRAVNKAGQLSIAQLNSKAVFKFQGNYNTGGRFNPVISTLGIADFTIEWWGAPSTSTSGGARFFELSAPNAGSNRTYYITLINSNISGSVAVNETVIVNPPPLEDNELDLHHYCLMRKNGVTQVYINGASVGSSSQVFDIAYNSLMIGAAADTDGGLNGYIQQFRVTKLARYTDSGFTPDADFER